VSIFSNYTLVHTISHRSFHHDVSILHHGNPSVSRHQSFHSLRGQRNQVAAELKRCVTMSEHVPRVHEIHLHTPSNLRLIMSEVCHNKTKQRTVNMELHNASLDEKNTLLRRSDTDVAPKHATAISLETQ